MNSVINAFSAIVVGCVVATYAYWLNNRRK
ncbi:type I toxin-antitoxin system Fst family toxin [Lactobacillus sp. YT155]